MQWQGRTTLPRLSTIALYNITRLVDKKILRKQEIESILRTIPGINDSWQSLQFFIEGRCPQYKREYISTYIKKALGHSINKLPYTFEIIAYNLLCNILRTTKINTFLFDAIHQKNNELAKIFIELGANPNIFDNSGQEIKLLLDELIYPAWLRNWPTMTPLMIACLYGNFELVKILIEIGADPNAKNNYDQTPLMMAAIGKDSKIIKLLIKKSANVHVQDKFKKTSLFYAFATFNDNFKQYQAMIDFKKMITLLLESGANPDTDNTECDTPLIMMARANCIDFVSLLLKYGANPLITSTLGKSPLYYAQLNHNEEMENIISQYIS